MQVTNCYPKNITFKQQHLETKIKLNSGPSSNIQSCIVGDQAYHNHLQLAIDWCHEVSQQPQVG